MPSLLEYFSYMFQHSTFLAGPVCTFNVYMDFIEGRDIARETKKVSGTCLKIDKSRNALAFIRFPILVIYSTKYPVSDWSMTNA